jgi:glycosyl transferase, family 25
MYPGKAFVINLKSDIERRKNITSQLEKQKIDYEIIDAVIGKNLSPETNPEIDWEFAKENAHWVSKGLLACTLSHLKAYRAIINQNLKFGLILEDDTTINSDVAALLSRVGDKLNENEVLMLYYAAWEKCLLSTVNSMDIFKNYKIVDPVHPKQLVSANAYIITNKACKGILDFQNPLKTTSDSWGVYIDNFAIERIRCMYPMLADTADFKSSIDYVNSNSIISPFLNAVEKYKIFPLYQFLKKRRIKMRKSMLNFELTNK